jgi:hypothetical protein
MITSELTNADLAYLEANYVTLNDLCADRTETPEAVDALIRERRLPQPHLGRLPARGDPNTIVRKNTLVASVSELLMLPRPASADWRESLRRQVDELDGLERDFTPDRDRSPAQERQPTRDLLIRAARERYPNLF